MTIETWACWGPTWCGVIAEELISTQQRASHHLGGNVEGVVGLIRMLLEHPNRVCLVTVGRLAPDGRRQAVQALRLQPLARLSEGLKR